jgi:outer membrane receptor for ferrienterochelin and colicins
MKIRLFIAFLLLNFSALTQVVNGKITSENGDVLPYATVRIANSNSAVTSDKNGEYSIQTSEKSIVLVVSYTGFITQRKNIRFRTKSVTQDFVLKEQSELLNQITITGTRTNKRQTNSPIIVDVINKVKLENVQACNLSESLNFQTGLRVETDCQTCNYTQLRMNGLAGGYSQILINGRPIFSPLTGLYGLEQVPANMIERIEVVRGGGSALYGSSAVGGTVNVITRIPKKNDYAISYTFQNISGASDQIIAGNATVVNDKKNAGISFFLNHRDRDFFDANGDNFSELPKLRNMSFGTNLFFLPAENQKLEINFSKMNEYRFGGEMVDGPAYLAQQSEERTHNVYVGNLDYQINFNEEKSSLITYLGFQHTDREHYTGIFPDDPLDIDNHVLNPPYGFSKTTTFQGGVQLNHTLENFFNTKNVITVGTEYIQDDVFDVIDAYNFKVDQFTKNWGLFFQSDWTISESMNLLSGFRVDDHNFVDNLIVSPRISFLYKPFKDAQVRATWSTGFRAPQAFDSDLHIAFAGGGVSRISLDPDLTHERSNSYTVSFNYDKPKEKYIYGFTLEGFHTRLNNAFTLENIGTDNFGERFEKRNGEGATVQGITIEGRLNYDTIVQWDAGFTIQSSLFDNAVINSDILVGKREFLRTPNQYGYSTLTYTPNEKFKASANLVYTGPMDVLHLASPGNLSQDEYFSSPSFWDLGVRMSYTFNLNTSNLEFYTGAKNLFNAYQTNFDVGKDRDSNFIFGPAIPRTFFIGIKFGS